MQWKEKDIHIRHRLTEWSLQVTDPRHEPVIRELGIVHHFPPTDRGHSTAGWYCGRLVEYTWALIVANQLLVKK
jgi:hypothetical protein